MGWHGAVTHFLHLGLEVCEVLASSDIEVPVGVLILAHAVGRIRRADAEQGRPLPVPGFVADVSRSAARRGCKSVSYSRAKQ